MLGRADQDSEPSLRRFTSPFSAPAANLGQTAVMMPAASACTSV
jgi:hypothetical protein